MTPGRPYSFGRLFRKRIIMAEDYDVEVGREGVRLVKRNSSMQTKKREASRVAYIRLKDEG